MGSKTRFEACYRVYYWLFLMAAIEYASLSKVLCKRGDAVGHNAKMNSGMSQ